jgi:hypothetical protein
LVPNDCRSHVLLEDHSFNSLGNRHFIVQNNKFRIAWEQINDLVFHEEIANIRLNSSYYFSLFVSVLLLVTHECVTAVVFMLLGIVKAMTFT